MLTLSSWADRDRLSELQLRFPRIQPSLETWTTAGLDPEEAYAHCGSFIPDYSRLGLKHLWLRAGKPELHCHYSFDRSKPKRGKGEPAFAHVHDLPCHGLTRETQKLDGQVNLVAEISAVLAFHPRNRHVENVTQHLCLNWLA
jgi:hypothetical protein